MPRPPAVPVDNIVDAEVCARAGSSIARHFTATDLPRLREAGALESSAIDASFQFSDFDGRPTVSGSLEGAVELMCQRCMRPVSIDIGDSFQVLVVEEDRSDEPGGYEPVVANASRLDLSWLTEEQALLALPLVPMHEEEDCAQSVVEQSSSQPDRESDESDADAEVDEGGSTTQHPFRNLRDLMNKRR